MPNCPTGGFTQAAGFSTNVVLGSKQWQLRFCVKSGTPGTRSISVFWYRYVERLVVAPGAKIGNPLAYRKYVPICQSRATHETALLLVNLFPPLSLGVV